MRMHDQGLYKRFQNLAFHFNPIPHFRFPLLSKCEGLAHAVFTRLGGTSNIPFESMNVSFNVGDDPGKVKTNLSRIRHSISARHLVTMNQIHGSNVIALSKEEINRDIVLPESDAVVTNAPGAALMVKLADCQGVILFSRENNVLGIAHCGWKGNVANILGKTVLVMEKTFGCDPKELSVAISPSLGPCCGEFKGYGEIFPSEFSRFMEKENHFDLWAISRRQLIDAGVKEENIETAGVCTKCNADLFFSYRKNKVTGRFAVVAMLT